MDVLGQSALLLGFLGRDVEALGRRMITMPVERVAAGETISTVVTEVNLDWVRLRSLTVALETAPCVQSSIGASSALDFLDHPTCPFVLRSLEQYLVPCL